MGQRANQSLPEPTRARPARQGRQSTQLMPQLAGGLGAQRHHKHRASLPHSPPSCGTRRRCSSWELCSHLSADWHLPAGGTFCQGGRAPACAAQAEPSWQMGPAKGLGPQGMEVLILFTWTQMSAATLSSPMEPLALCLSRKHCAGAGGFRMSLLESQGALGTQISGGGSGERTELRSGEQERGQERPCSGHSQKRRGS